MEQTYSNIIKFEKCPINDGLAFGKRQNYLAYAAKIARVRI